MAFVQATGRHLLPRSALARSLSTIPAGAFRSHRPRHRVHLLFGANTDVGKSVVSAGLVRAAAASLRRTPVNYIKPLQCGGSDESFVLRHLEGYVGGGRRASSVSAPEVPAPPVNCRTLFRWETPASPHLASRLENLPVSDEEVMMSLRSSLEEIDANFENGSGDAIIGGVTIIESAGGVLSPSSSSPLNRSSAMSRWGWLTQADLYAPLGLPVIFVGDGKLGGISVTLASLEALWSRGYHVDAVVFVEETLGDEDEEDDIISAGDKGDIHFGKGNAEALREYIAMNPRDDEGNRSTLDDDSIICLPPLPRMPIPLENWYEGNQGAFLQLHNLLCQRCHFSSLLTQVEQPTRATR